MAIGSLKGATRQFRWQIHNIVMEILILYRSEKKGSINLRRAMTRPRRWFLVCSQLADGHEFTDYCFLSLDASAFWCFCGFQFNGSFFFRLALQIFCVPSTTQQLSSFCRNVYLTQVCTNCSFSLLLLCMATLYLEL